MNKILLVEDDRELSANLEQFLTRENFSVVVANGQGEAFDILDREAFELVLLDISLNDGNGFAVCNRVKSEHDTPVIFLTASGDEYSVVAGFDAGADDYISKPFRPRELLSRIKNALRKYNKNTVISYGNISVDAVKGIVKKDGHDLFLSALEYKLLLVFFNNPGTVMSRGRLLEEIWDVAGDYVNDNTLTVYIKRLREKIEDDPQNPVIIETVRGMGYRVGGHNE
ncbi:MAG: response regulator transcription factor [Butyrivibrio sp.]|nr:response regulator transcription factor [Butyrivibrio sp.]